MGFHRRAKRRFVPLLAGVMVAAAGGLVWYTSAPVARTGTTPAPSTSTEVTPTPGPQPTAPTSGAVTTPTPSTSASVTAAPGPRPTVVTVVTAFPDASTTGVPAGTRLVPYTGPMVITKDNTFIDGRLIDRNTGSGYNDMLIIQAKNVLIKNCRFINAGTNQVSVDDGYPQASVTIQDSEFAPPSPPDAAVRGRHWTLLRDHLHGFLDGVHPDGDNRIQDSYIHGFIQPAAGEHVDGIQTLGGTGNIAFEHNTIFFEPTHDMAGAIQFGTENGATHDVTINNNLLAGGTFTIYSSYGYAASFNIRVTNNHFSRRIFAYYGANGYLYPGWTRTSNAPGGVWTGNVDADTGAAIPLPDH